MPKESEKLRLATPQERKHTGAPLFLLGHLAINPLDRVESGLTAVASIA